MPHFDDTLGMEFFEFPMGDGPGHSDMGGEPGDDLQGVVKRQIEEALDWREQYLDPDQEKATDYYMGRPFGGEQEGRSQVVSTDVRDAAHATMPSIMRVLVGPERVVEYIPRSAEDEEMARQQTDYINYVFMQDNPGYSITYDACMDGLIRKMGIVTWWWDDDIKVDGSEHTGIDEAELRYLQSLPNVEVVSAELDEDDGTYSVSIRREYDDGRARVGSVPPEEFLFSPSARSLDDAIMVGRVREVRADELRAMGVPDDVIDEARGEGRELEDDELPNARRLDEGDERLFEDEQGEATRPIRFADLYVYYDDDEDGIAELRHVQAVGMGATIVHNEIVDERPFALFVPHPEPHTIVGLSQADLVMDLQKIKSFMTRGMLDSLAMSLQPSTEVVEGEVNIKDLLNPEVGRIVRVTRPGMMREVIVPFVGKEALPALQYIDEMRENRTGHNKAAAGLDADALQSTTKAGVAATLSAAQQRIEMIIRNYAENGMQRIFKGLLRLVVRNQTEPRIVRLRNQFVPVDPTGWDADMDVQVNVALGSGMAEEKLAQLAAIAEKQELLLSQGAPLVSFVEYRNTLARMTELAGFRNSNEFWKPFGPQEMQQWIDSQPEPPPSEVEVLREVEMAKLEGQISEHFSELRFKIADASMEDDRERDKIALDYAAKIAEIEAKTGVKIEEARLRAMSEQLRAELDADLGRADLFTQLLSGAPDGAAE